MVLPCGSISLAGTRKVLRDGTYLPRPSSVTITVHPPIFPKAAAAAGNSPVNSDWHELIRLRDAAREVIARDSGEPVL